ncbi:Polyamine transporter 4-like protein 3 [Colletotrichum chlorophyti]|uniref:Polyamine transporter 4-like protein 3 n=1 Tax=Colletotrichum chlorophyti TaxID=708187 RepID=A0A1Q8RG71_9PEZI|nr:Polyamine transporter 4-like protein 3 [Colletotrichum chlorophyti]
MLGKLTEVATGPPSLHPGSHLDSGHSHFLRAVICNYLHGGLLWSQSGCVWQVIPTTIVPLVIRANGILRYTFGAVFPLFTVDMYEDLGVHWAGSVFAFLSLLLMPIPWLLLKYGSRLRQRSKFVA